MAGNINIISYKHIQVSWKVKKLLAPLFCNTYPNEVIVSLETNTYGVFTPSHWLWNIWCSKVPLTDETKTLKWLNVSKRWKILLNLNHTIMSHISSIHYLQLMKLSVLPVIQLEFLFHCNTHSQLFLPWAGLLRTKGDKIYNWWEEMSGKIYVQHRWTNKTKYCSYCI